LIAKHRYRVFAAFENGFPVDHRRTACTIGQVDKPSARMHVDGARLLRRMMNVHHVQQRVFNEQRLGLERIVRRGLFQHSQLTLDFQREIDPRAGR
jgi:hypothetical protein